MKAPTNKLDFYRGWQAGKFGNRIRTFDNLSLLQESEYRGPVTIRYKQTGSPYCRYLVPQSEIESHIDSCVLNGADRAMFTFNEPAPDDQLTMQGEVYRSTVGLYLFCSHDQLPMRKALEQSGKGFFTIQALGRLQKYCNAKSYDMLMDLLDDYPDGVVEFSCYDRNLGNIPGHNTIIWELRNY